MNIALDVMGGDHAPQEVVLGAIAAAREYGVTVSLVGKPDTIRKELARHKTDGLRLPIVPASQVIEMDDKPAAAVRTKPDNSMSVGCKLVRTGEAHAFVTAGNTGGALAAGILHVGRVKGVMRPALITPIPTKTGFCIVLDVGANADCRPEYFPQFAIMGTLYAREVFGIASPTVRLLSNGEEEGKGNQLMINASHMLVDTPGINFLGNVESKDVFKGVVDVVVTDGFTGNIFLKTAESASRLLQDVMSEEIRRRPNSMLGGMFIKGALKRVKARMDDSEYGGAVLLGLGGIVVVAHGKSKANAIRNAIRVAKQGVESDVPGKIEAAVAQDKVHAPLVAAVA
jgi:glycerol-3-phosphate acyltransferase PlsX